MTKINKTMQTILRKELNLLREQYHLRTVHIRVLRKDIPSIHKPNQLRWY